MAIPKSIVMLRSAGHGKVLAASINLYASHTNPDHIFCISKKMISRGVEHFPYKRLSAPPGHTVASAHKVLSHRLTKSSMLLSAPVLASRLVNSLTFL